MAERTQDGRPVRIVTVRDEDTRACLASVVARQLGSQAVSLLLTELVLHHGVPQPIRSDHGPECIAITLRPWLTQLRAAPRSIEPGSPWENGSRESFNGKMREPVLNGERFSTLKDAQSLIERWRIHDHTVRPHRRLGGQPPVPETVRLASEGLTG